MKRPHSDAGRLSSGPDRLWKAINSFHGQPFTVGQIHAKAGRCSRDTVKLYVSGLIRLGVLTRAGVSTTGATNRFKAHLYICVRPHGAAPRISYGPVSGHYSCCTMQLWNAMRILPSFTTHELALAASTEESPIKRSRAMGYLIALQHAGLVEMLEPRHGGPRGSTKAIWRLTPRANTGPRPPQVSRVHRGVFDPNRQQFFPNVEEAA